MKKLLIFFLLRRRKEYSGIVRFRRKNYKIVIEEFVPASEWVNEALHKAEPEIK